MLALQLQLNNEPTHQEDNYRNNHNYTVQELRLTELTELEELVLRVESESCMHTGQLR